MAMATAMTTTDTYNADIAIEQWKLRRTVQYLSTLRGRGTSLITMIVPADSQLSRSAKLLSDEIGLSSCIKSSQTRHNVQQALSSAQGRLRLYTQHTMPSNGFVIFAGVVYDEEQHRETKISMCIEPLQALKHALYRCESHFITGFLQQQINDCLNSDQTCRYGIMIVDGNGALFARLDSQQGLNVIKRFQVSLPKKHGRGGQSAARFERLRRIAIHTYLTKVADNAKSVYLNNQQHGLINVDGIILGGSANIKQELVKSELLGTQIQSKIIRLVDISYGGDYGLQETMRLCADMLTDMKLTQERQLLDDTFTQIRLSSINDSTDSISYAIGIDETSTLINDDAGGLIDQLIIWENLTTKRYVYRQQNEQVIVIVADNEQDAQRKLKFYMKNSENEKIECIDEMNFLDYLTENYRQLHIRLHLVTDRSPEGQQFCLGFGGCAALLRYPVPTSIFDTIRNDSAEPIDDYDE
jgi:peptide chain release factor subunit 1